MIWDISSDIRKPQNPRSQKVADLMTEFELMNLLHHLFHRCRYRHINMWPRERQGRGMWSSSNYILGTDRRHSKMMGIRDVRKYPSDHLVLLARILFSPTEEGHQCDAGGLLAQAGTMYGGSKYNES